jgi:hypothetical protein
MMSGSLLLALLIGLAHFMPFGSAGIQGVDVSHHQAPLDWAPLRGQGIRFAYFKTSEGADWNDPRYREYAEAARASGAPAVPPNAWIGTFCAAGKGPCGRSAIFRGRGTI